MKKIRLAVLLSVLVLPLVGIGTVYAINKTLSKDDEVTLKQEMKPQDTVNETQLVGIFAPGFEAELAETKIEYAKAYGNGNFQVLEYNGYTLVVPPSISTKALNDAKAQADHMALDQQNSMLNTSVQASQIAKIREIFGVEGIIEYNTSLQAYTDEKGFQYNFRGDELISKQVGITTALHTKFEAAYPYLKSEITRTAIVSNDQAQVTADQAISKLFAPDLANDLKTYVQKVNLGDARIGFVYGDQEVYILIDQVSGDIINLNRAN